jgi:hypothetical protein
MKIFSQKMEEIKYEGKEIIKRRTTSESCRALQEELESF